MKVIEKLDWNLLQDQKDELISSMADIPDPTHPRWGLIEFLSNLIDEHDTGQETTNQHLAGKK